VTDPRRRAGPGRLAGRQRTKYLAQRIGIALRESRLAVRLTQAAASARAGVSQPFWSRLERGAAGTASLETLASCAAAVETQLATFLEAVPGANLPRDLEHMRRQQLLVATARSGGWVARPERPIDPAARRSRSIDIELERATRREIAVVEIEDLLTDGGAAMRGLADKVAAVRREVGASWTVSGVLILRATRRNRGLVREFADLFDARFPAPSVACLAAMREPGRAMPREDGFLWSSVDGTRLFAARLGVRHPARRPTNARTSGSSHGPAPETALARA
jgi:transcriptional regulator with XRE-family HTH domain